MHVLPQTCNRNWGLQRGAAQWTLTSLAWIRLLVQGQHFRHWFAPPLFCTTRACLPDGRGTWAWCLGTLAFLQACWQQRKRQQEQFAASLVNSKRIIQDTVTTRIFPLTHVSPEWAFRTVRLPVLEPVRQSAPQAQRERSVKIKLKIKKTYFENKNNTILKIKDLAAKIKWFSSKN